MSLNSHQKKQIRKWLELNVNRSCPACDLANWIDLRDEIFTLPSKSDSIVSGGELKLVAVICKKCGFTALFHLDEVGSSTNIDLHKSGA